MSNKSLSKLTRNELLDLLYEQEKRVEDLEKRNKQLETQLEDRRIKISKVGSIADASLALTNVFAEAQKAGAATINYGLFLNTVINFLIIAAAIFFMITWINKLKDIFMAEEKAAPADPTTKICPFCLSEIPLKAKKCAHCTSDLK